MAWDDERWERARFEANKLHGTPNTESVPPNTESVPTATEWLTNQLGDVFARVWKEFPDLKFSDRHALECVEFLLSIEARPHLLQALMDRWAVEHPAER